MTYVPRTLHYVSLVEATIRTTRGGEDAFSRAALGARLSPGKKATVYVDPRGQYSYGIASQSTGGKSAPKGSKAVAELTPGTGGRAVIRRQAKKGRMKQQLDRIARSSRLSPEERARYEAAAKAKEGRMALPSGAREAVKRATVGVDPRRKIAGDELAKRSAGRVKAQSRTQRALSWLKRKAGLARRDAAGAA